MPIRFLRRPNRYLAIVQRESGGSPFAAHVPNPGRMEELLVPGDTLGFAVPAARPGRKTRFDLVAVRHGPELVSIDSRVANRLVAVALPMGIVAGLPHTHWRAEPTVGHARLDFGRFHPGTGRPEGYLEVKSSNLRVGEEALFPDAPTQRGRRHLEVLTSLARRGIRCDVLFAIQRDDVRAFRPNRVLDPEFAAALDRARGSGVGVHAIRMQVSPDRVRLSEVVPVVDGVPQLAHPILYRRASAIVGT
ncbi:MAG TPA: DNA/RNA nuclease SfsA [Thermoplasmata archaeon]|nr:DNA/RNA nuclease SfsA [Thermoplasmata archaeon]